MKNNFRFTTCGSTFFLILMIMFSKMLNAQVDSTQPVQTDTIKPILADTAVVKTKKEKTGRKDAFLVYGGANLNNLDVENASFNADGGLGYHLGVAYRRGKFFYWQAGARYNRAVYNLLSLSTASDTSKLTVNSIDLPLVVGVNLLSFMDRLVGVRIFAGAVPSFTIGVGDNDVNVDKEDINSFVMYGQAGVGVDVAFLLIEAGYNFGFNDLLKNYSNSNPGQAFLSVGFRF